MEKLIDATSGHQVMCFLDAYAGPDLHAFGRCGEDRFHPESITTSACLSDSSQYLSEAGY